MNRILVAAAHADDESLGCGATIAKHVAAGDIVRVLITADGVTSREPKPGTLTWMAVGQRVQTPSGATTELLVDNRKRRNTSAESACEILGVHTLILKDYRDNEMDTYSLLTITRSIEEQIAIFQPSVVYTHHDGDLNVDHRVTCEAVRVACRPQPGQCVKWLLHFEVPCSTAYGSGFVPDYFVNVEAHMDAKINACRSYAEEMRESPHPRSLAGVVRLAEHRGSAVGVKFAEAFKVGRGIA